MIEKIKKISNPLTIIAIFAGLAEVASSGALIAVDKNIQIILKGVKKDSDFWIQSHPSLSLNLKSYG